MRRSTKLCWIAFVFSTIIIAVVTGLTVYFTVFRKSSRANSSSSSSPTSTDGGTAGSGTSGRDADAKSGLFDHRSHAVPGADYEAIDYQGAGFVRLTLDGSRSHTHYFDEGPPVVIGKIVSMVWFNNATRQVLGTGVSPSISFPTGVTVVGLTVADNTRDTHTDYTRVIVTPPMVHGVYCYYYYSDVIDDDIAQGPRPDYAAPAKSIQFTSTAQFPSQVNARTFVVRCTFLATVKKGTRFLFKHAGPIKFSIDGTTILESSENSSSVIYTGLPGKVQAQLIYTRESTAEAKLELDESVGQVEYDLSKLVPVVFNIDPPSSTLDGGGKAKIHGVSLGNNVKIFFGSKEAKYSVNDIAEDGSSIIVTVPKPRAPGRVEVFAQNKNGKSNPIDFAYSEDGRLPIKFEETQLTKDGSPFKLELISGIKYGPDHKFYATALNGYVYSFIVDEKLRVVDDPCRSPSLGLHRALLGLAFNYADSRVRVYVSSSVLEWKSQGRLSSDFAWANGQIHVLEPGANKNCLDQVGDPIITGLPVSNHDHGVNGIVFDDDGNLHIQVGGFTNAGHNAEDNRLGGIDENPLSGASIIAYVSKSNFDGKIRYSSPDPGEARQTKGLDVKVFSSGWRNSFGINIHSNGFIYATDNGASIGFGEMSKSCKEHGTLPDNQHLLDKLGKVIKGTYCGHPNRNRGRTDPKQCAFVGVKAPASNGYHPPIATFESSTNGVLEYTADTFGGQLKGNLMLSKYTTDQSPGKVFRVKLNKAGDLDGVPESLWEASGLSIEMSPYGELLMPRVYKRQILVLRPLSTGNKIQTFRAVMPPRGSRRGGNVVIITGYNIGRNPVATFNGVKCTNVTDVTATSFKCRVPPGKPGTIAKVAIESLNGLTNSSDGGSGADYKYMKI